MSGTQLKKKKKQQEISQPRIVRPLKPLSAYTNPEDLKLIIQNAIRLGDLEYASMAESRLTELNSALPAVKFK
jgi:hypothetical protein